MSRSEATAPRARFELREGFLAGAIVWLVPAGRRARGSLARLAGAVASVVTLLGRWVGALVALSFVLGYVLGWSELVAIAWAGLVLTLVASLYLLGRNAYRVALTMTADRVVVGERVPGHVAVENASQHRVPGVRVEVPVGAGIAEFLTPSLGRGGSTGDEFMVPTTRRGVIPIGPVHLVRGDPLGLFRRERSWEERRELFVHPRTISIPSLSTGLIRDLEGSPTRDLTSSDIAFHALREYLPGDERRNIHWKSTAKAGTYMVRQFEQSRRSHLVVALGLGDQDYETDDEFELAVSVTGSLAGRAIRDARTVSVVVGDGGRGAGRRGIRRLSTLTRTRLLDDLSRLERSSAALPLAELGRQAGESTAGISVAFLICGSATTSGQLREASRTFPAGVDVVAVICDPEAVPSFRRVAELTVLRIGYLEDLQKSLARSAAA
ncbi:DUF58 domain-containing protein [Cryobacterium tepidiphilum]|uniref:DUF58 domain-containing protein n=1 Tax=Cryobacterium tepidiphilum TaxID=2486026 RepID=A0A3M8LG55_9MICO|nr:DUF58 domain-containing protein [Cryobacterium tepidiphilum]RNE63674.1 DUF58 domain-containing protein [Cryobacterium tepidiphilum]